MTWLQEYLSKPVDTGKIIDQTLEIFKSSGAYDRLQTISSLNEIDYRLLHKNFLTPIDITFDHLSLEKELFEFEKYFESWGLNNRDQSRQGLALVNETGYLFHGDPINGSLMEYNHKTGKPFLEIDFTFPTAAFEVNSLKTIKSLSDRWLRSNILRWKEGAKFVPHIDAVVPCHWLRLWAIDKPENIILRYWNGSMEIVKDIEPGRLYIIDTSLIHDAVCIGPICHQLFLSLPIEKFYLLKNMT